MQLEDDSDSDDWQPDFSDSGVSLTNPIEVKFTNQVYKS